MAKCHHPTIGQARFRYNREQLDQRLAYSSRRYQSPKNKHPRLKDADNKGNTCHCRQCIYTPACRCADIPRIHICHLYRQCQHPTLAKTDRFPRRQASQHQNNWSKPASCRVRRVCAIPLWLLLFAWGRLNFTVIGADHDVHAGFFRLDFQ